MKFLNICLAGLGLLGTLGVTKVNAQTYQEITTDKCNSAIYVDTYPGKITTIDLSPINHNITYLGLGDRSRHVVNTNIPLETGQAKSIFVLPIQKINFEGATTSNTPNLVIQAKSGNGPTVTCNFFLTTNTSTVKSLGIKFIEPEVPQVEPVVAKPLEPGTFFISHGRKATADDLEAGIDVALGKGYTNPSDPVVNQIYSIAFALRNGSTIEEALESTNLSSAVVNKVAEFGLDLPKKTTLIAVEEKPKPVTQVTTKAKAPIKQAVKAKELDPVTRIQLAGEILLRLNRELNQKLITSNSSEYQTIKQIAADIRRGLSVTDTLENNPTDWKDWILDLF